jgi:phage-related minor tail protein
MRSLPAQFTDIATQLAGGQSPFLILLQQGGQIKDQFGGVKGALLGRC